MPTAPFYKYALNSHEPDMENKPAFPELDLHSPLDPSSQRSQGRDHILLYIKKKKKLSSRQTSTSYSPTLISGFANLFCISSGEETYNRRSAVVVYMTDLYDNYLADNEVRGVQERKFRVGPHSQYMTHCGETFTYFLLNSTQYFYLSLQFPHRKK